MVLSSPHITAQSWTQPKNTRKYWGPTGLILDVVWLCTRMATAVSYVSSKLTTRLQRRKIVCLYEELILDVCILLRVWDQGEGVSRLRNVFTICYLLKCYMFPSYDHLQVEIYLLETTLVTTQVSRHRKIFTVYYLLNCYMFPSYDHLEVEIYLLEITLVSTDSLY
jgi:hypothetical protein